MKKPLSPIQILGRLYLGGLEDAEALIRANPHQIETVITLCRERVTHRLPGIHYVHFPVPDGRSISIAWLNAIFSSMEEGMSQGSVLVHCGAGMSRSSAVYPFGHCSLIHVTSKA